MTNINTLKYLPMSIQIIKCIISIISEDIILYRALGVDSDSGLMLKIKDLILNKKLVMIIYLKLFFYFPT